MKARITSISHAKSRYGGECLLLTFKGDDARSYRTWLYPAFRNFQQWKPFIKKGVGVLLSNLNVKKGNLIDADSIPEEYRSIGVTSEIVEGGKQEERTT